MYSIASSLLCTKVFMFFVICAYISLQSLSALSAVCLHANSSTVTIARKKPTGPIALSHWTGNTAKPAAGYCLKPTLLQRKDITRHPYCIANRLMFILAKLFTPHNHEWFLCHHGWWGVQHMLLKMKKCKCWRSIILRAALSMSAVTPFLFHSSVRSLGFQHDGNIESLGYRSNRNSTTSLALII